MITVEHLTKCYGKVTAVKDLSFTIDGCGVYGFLGPNGAGKSTTMNILTGCLSATEGAVTIGGRDIYEEPAKAKRQIGYLPEQPPLYVSETPEEYLRFVGQAKGLKGNALREQMAAVIEKTGLGAVKGRLISSLSKGYKQRVGIAQALLGDPDIIILDEPTVGLDPIQIIEIRELIRGLGETHTVIFSSHILSEVQAICEKVLIISAGRLVAFDTPDALERTLAGAGGIRLKVLAGQEEAEAVLSGMDELTDWTVAAEADGAADIRITTAAEDIRGLCVSLFRAFAAQDLPIFEMNAKKATLEEVFIELTEQPYAPDEAPAAEGEAPEDAPASEPEAPEAAEEEAEEAPRTDEASAPAPESEEA